MIKGKVIVLEGCDGSGKATQTEKLYNRLVEEGYKVRKVEYPNYSSDSSALVKMYLNGQLGHKPEDVNAYAASSFFAVDRFASYKTEWKEFYENGGIIIADRYTTANMIHQASKISNSEERSAFLDWLWNFEFELFKLPIPDCVIFLDMPPQYSKKLMQDRANKITGEQGKDIHEKDYDYLIHSYNNAYSICEKYKWDKISCIENENIKTIDKIHEDIYIRIKEKVLSN